MRAPNHQAENRALLRLARELASSPTGFLQALSDGTMALCKAHSAGVSILEEHAGAKLFRWHAVSGRFAPNIWGTMPRDASPCGVVIDRNATQLMIKPHRAWVLMHDEERGFDAKDARVLESLGQFASSAYEILYNLHALSAGDAPGR